MIVDQVELMHGDVSVELWREYDWVIGYDENGEEIRTVYRIGLPVEVMWRPNGGTTHRVMDMGGVVHLVPAPGEKGCILRWLNKEGEIRARW